MNIARNAGLLMVRAAVGGTLAVHGTQKLFGWFGGGGLDATAANFEKMGFTPGRQAALAAGLGEGLGGAMLALGAATPIAGAAAAGTMAVASSTHAPNGFLAARGGMEFPLNLGTVAAGIALIGPGSWSVDRLFRHRYSKSWMAIAAGAAFAQAARTTISRRQRALAEQARAQGAEAPAPADSAPAPADSAPAPADSAPAPADSAPAPADSAPADESNAA